MNIGIKTITSALAECVWETSPQATAFTRPAFLSAVCDEVVWWAALKGEELLCVWPIPKDGSGEAVRLPFTYYIGPIWSSRLLVLPPYRWFATSQRIYEKLIAEILLHHPNLNFSLPVGQQDLRAFLWWNYGNPVLPRFTITPRYTARINDLLAKSDMDIANAFKKDERRTRIRHLLRQPPPLSRVTLDKPGTILDLYQSAIKRTGGKVSETGLQTLVKIISYIQEGNGEVLCFADDRTSSIVAAQVVLDGCGAANAIARCVRQDWLVRDATVWLTYHSIIEARDRGLSVYDFNGANSPNRADDKHAFGADYELYFDLSYGK